MLLLRRRWIYNGSGTDGCAFMAEVKGDGVTCKEPSHESGKGDIGRS